MKAPSRIVAPDILRGVVMVVMLLDHTRLFTHTGALAFDPTDLERTNTALFLTRWVTHFCAPLFVLLAGMSAAFQVQRGKSLPELSSFLIKRGIWLCFLELIVIRAITFWRLDPYFFFLQVIWALGVSMIALGVLVRWPRAVVLGVGAAMVLLHNAFDGITVAEWAGPESPALSIADKVWMFLHQAGPFPIAGWPSPVVMTQYPLIPWIGVMALGWLLGDVYAWEPARRQRALMRLGVALTAAFVLLRAANVYGDLTPWSAQSTAVFTALSFLNTTKYPPSLLFLLMTIGPGLIALAWLDRRYGDSANRDTDTQREPSGIVRALTTYGRVPLFFYLLQWTYAKVAGYLIAYFAGQTTAIFTQFPFDWDLETARGFGLPVTYAVWGAGVVLLYWPCRWFAGVKARRRDWWLSYL